MAAATVVPSPTASTPLPARVNYPSNRLANVRDLKAQRAPQCRLSGQRCAGRAAQARQARARLASVPTATSSASRPICPHKGFPLSYNKSDHTLNCPGHYSRFDCDAGGQQIWGQATQNLPQYMLRVDANGDIYAEGVDELLYGRLSNVL